MYDIKQELANKLMRMCIADEHTVTKFQLNLSVLQSEFLQN